MQTSRSIRWLISMMFALVGIIHLLPLAGAVGVEQLTSLYGLNFTEPNIALLMRHRAVLFGLLGLFMLLAVFKPQWQPWPWSRAT